MVTLVILTGYVRHMSFGNNIEHVKQAQRIPAIWQPDIVLMA